MSVRWIAVPLLVLLATACAPDGEAPSGSDADSVTPRASAPEPPLSGDDLAVIVEAEEALAGDRPENVASILAPLLARERTPAKALFDMGWAHYNLNEYGACVELMDRALAQDPTLAALARVLGFAHFKLGDYDAARGVFEHIVDARPDAYKAHYGLALVAFSDGDVEAARIHLDRALALKGDYLKARQLEARVLAAEGLPEQALEVVTGVLARQPSHEEAIYLLSQVLADLGREDEARAAGERWRRVYDARDRISLLEKRLREGNQDSALVLSMAAEFEAVGDLGEALRVVRDGLRRFGSRPELLALHERLSSSR